jgi:secondary thiamine-phosphate synthase enzyme
MILTFSTKGNTYILDITEQVQEAVTQEKLEEGVVVLFVSGSTAALTTIETDINLYDDFREVLEKIIPMGKSWKHHETWGDDNGGSHLRASLIGPSLSIPVVNGKMVLGTWQKIVLIDFDTSSRQRKVVVSLLHNKTG